MCGGGAVGSSVTRDGRGVCVLNSVRNTTFIKTTETNTKVTYLNYKQHVYNLTKNQDDVKTTSLLIRSSASGLER